MPAVPYKTYFYVLEKKNNLNFALPKEAVQLYGEPEMMMMMMIMIMNVMR